MLALGAEAFAGPQQPFHATRMPTTALAAAADQDEDSTMSRRQVMFGALAATVATLAASPEPASATYSAFAAREKDWQERQEKGEVNFKSAKDLRAQLREIAPMNTVRQNIF